jgi:SNF2 family DNA or RNA helicase
MGMGKTVEVLALLLSRPAAPEVVSGTLHPTSGKIMSRGTLVVCAVSLVGQWEAEVEAKLADENVRVYKYHGGSRTRNVRKLCQYDLVITTYGILASDEGGRAHKGEDALGKIHWHRVVFDEGEWVSWLGTAWSVLLLKMLPGGTVSALSACGWKAWQSRPRPALLMLDVT